MSIRIPKRKGSYTVTLPSRTCYQALAVVVLMTQQGSGVGGGAIEFFAHDKGNFVLQQNMSTVNGDQLGGTGGSGSGGAIRIEAGSVELYGKLSAAGGLPNIEHAKLGHGGGGRIAVHNERHSRPPAPTPMISQATVQAPMAYIQHG